jgi:hypothetical protein
MTSDAARSSIRDASLRRATMARAAPSRTQFGAPIIRLYTIPINRPTA